MSIERYSRTIPASGVIEHSNGNFVLLLTATAAVNLRADRQGWSEGFNGITGGVLIRRIKPWDGIQIIGVAGTTVEYIVGQEVVEKDETDIRLQIATIAGVAAFSEQPSATFVTTVANTDILTANSADVAANLSRRRITVVADSANTGSLRVRDQAATTDGGIELQPGMFVELKTTAAFRILNNSGATQAYSLQEEV